MVGKTLDLKQTELDFDDVAPDASVMIEATRAYGYTLSTAIADLIDNSIAAESRNIWLQFEWNGIDSWISILDDGNGMSETELVAAMRLGSQNPLQTRATSDLGRWGLGLKTASFSQGRRLTVVSRTDSEGPHLRRWDLDHLAQPDVKGWQLLKSTHPDTGDRASLLDKEGLRKGTQVLLERLDRLVGTGESARLNEDHFVNECTRVRDHLAMVFHRFLSRTGKNALQIHLNGEAIQPWDPFLQDHTATQEFPEDEQWYGDHEVPIKVRGFVLPHKDRLGHEAHARASGPEGWNAHQGFYLYRGERLIIAGDWLGLGWKKEEHFKLARIRIDVPNSMDHEWTINVTKSSASPPPVQRQWLKEIARTIREQAKKAYSHRGAYGPHAARPETQPSPWKSTAVQGGGSKYKILRNHPVLEPLIKSLPKESKSTLEALLKLIEETVPVDKIFIDRAENEDGGAAPFSQMPDHRLRDLIENCHKVFVDMGKDPEEAWDILAAFIGFRGDDAQAIIQQVREEKDR